MTVEICVGSSCHLKGSQRIVELMRKAIEENGLDLVLTLAGCFCAGRCNRVGVTVIVDGEVFEGVTPEGFDAFFKENILSKI